MDWLFTALRARNILHFLIQGSLFQMFSLTRQYYDQTINCAIMENGVDLLKM